MRTLSVLFALQIVFTLAGCGGQGPQLGSPVGSNDSNFGFGSSSSSSRGTPSKLAASFWGLESLKRQVQAEEISTATESAGDLQIVVKEISYEGERWEGNQTKVFGYLAYPVKAKGIRLPAVIQVHDVGRTASRESAKDWASRGYAALSIDLPGHGPSREASRSTGPDMTVDNIFKCDQSAKESWLFPAASAVIRGVTVLANTSVVDPFRIGIVGYGWGGVIALIANGTDSRVKAACSVYGAGYLSDKSAWTDLLKKMPSKQRKMWTDAYDPASYVKSQSGPVLYLTATGEKQYALTSFEKTVKETQGEKRAALTANGGKLDSMAAADVPLWFDWALKGGSAFPRVETQMRGDKLTVTAKGGRPAVKAVLYRKTEAGERWESLESKAEKGAFNFTMPASASPLSYFVSVIDDQGGVVSSEIGTHRSKNVKTANNRR